MAVLFHASIKKNRGFYSVLELERAKKNGDTEFVACINNVGVTSKVSLMNHSKFSNMNLGEKLKNKNIWKLAGQALCHRCVGIPVREASTPVCTNDHNRGTPGNAESTDPGACAGCGLRLQEGQALVALDKQWHVWCFKCHSCDTVLHGEYMGKYVSSMHHYFRDRSRFLISVIFPIIILLKRETKERPERGKSSIAITEFH